MDHSALPRILFAGTPEFAAISLKRLIQAGYSPVAVYTQPDRPAGRGRRLRPSPVKQLAEESGIPVQQPTRLSSPEAQSVLAEFAPTLMIVAAYGLLLPASVLAIPTLGCINIHASLLPRWRGAAPIQRALLAGDHDSGISLMQMDTGLDTGAVLATAHCPIPPNMTGGELHNQLAQLGAELLVEHLPAILAGATTPQPQDEHLACYAHKVDKSEAQIDWHQSATQLARPINAFNPWPVAWTPLGAQRLRLWRAYASATPTTAEPGSVVAESAEGIVVATGSGRLHLLHLQLPGRQCQPAGQFIQGYSLLGRILGQP
jgi:methionyl-tRNA formyltransferase